MDTDREPMTVGELTAFFAANNIPEETPIYMETVSDDPRVSNGSAPVYLVNVEIGSNGYTIVNVMLPPSG